MRVVGVCVWLFLNLVFLGMAAYLYLLWVQYWRYARANAILPQQKHSGSYSSSLIAEVQEIEVRPGRPRFHSSRRFLVPPGLPQQQQAQTRVSTNRSTTTTTTTTTTTPTPMTYDQLLKAIEKHKMDLTVQLRTTQKNGGSILSKRKNKYAVKYRGGRIRNKPTREQLLCALRRVCVRALRDGDEPFTSQGMAKHFPSSGLLEGRHFNTCAVVSSAGALKASHLGNFIDSHDAVVRFNHAPTEGFEQDVGSRTTLRIVNSQVVTKPQYDFWGSPLYSGVSLLVWDPSNYTATLQQWYQAPDFDLFPVFFRRRLMLPQEDLHLLHPESLWQVWDVLQRHTHTRLLPNPPSSGFLGIVLMLAHCQTVDAVEFVPSLRLTKQCHYWDSAALNSGCTFGDWHPLATEKLHSLLLNEASDIDTFSRGFIRIQGFSKLKCPSDDSNRAI